ncbi:DUF1269 domain-containing protein [Microlunatus ginsengisoli]|uniref:DUF1269 domain-containing protein n=1 Tax=Microlunatus ginsengisoli TaxID=363863 RepID=A0ABP7AFU5_9ACTN
MSDQPTTEGPEATATELTAAIVTDGAYALFVADFSDTDSAWGAYQALERATKANRLDIEGALVLKKDTNGEIKVQKATDDRTRRGLTWGLVGGVVIGALFPPSILASAAVMGAAGAGIGRLRHLHNRSELADELSQTIEPGHSGLVVLVSDPAVIEIEKALAKANRVVQKAVDKAVAEDIKAEAAAADAAAAEGR